jgi:hypothetical protein
MLGQQARQVRQVRQALEGAEEWVDKPLVRMLFRELVGLEELERHLEKLHLQLCVS